MSDILKSIMDAAGVTNQKDLACLLGISRRQVSDAVRRGVVPEAWMEILRKKKGIKVYP